MEPILSQLHPVYNLTHIEVFLKGVDWIHMTQDKDQRQTPVNMVMDLWFCKTWVLFSNLPLLSIFYIQIL